MHESASLFSYYILVFCIRATRKRITNFLEKSWNAVLLDTLRLLNMQSLVKKYVADFEKNWVLYVPKIRVLYGGPPKKYFFSKILNAIRKNSLRLGLVQIFMNFVPTVGLICTEKKKFLIWGHFVWGLPENEFSWKILKCSFVKYIVFTFCAKFGEKICRRFGDN